MMRKKIIASVPRFRWLDAVNSGLEKLRNLLGIWAFRDRMFTILGVQRLPVKRKPKPATAFLGNLRPRPRLHARQTVLMRAAIPEVRLIRRGCAARTKCLMP